MSRSIRLGGTAEWPAPRGCRSTWVKASCYGEDLATFGTLSVGDITRPDVLTDPQWQKAYRKSLLGTRKPGGPAYIYHATSDTIVPFGLGQQLYRSWCAKPM